MERSPERNDPKRPSPAARAAVEHTHWSWGLMGFYMSCAGVALGAAIAAASHWFFRSPGGTWFGAALSFVACFTTYFTLRAARRPKQG